MGCLKHLLKNTNLDVFPRFVALEPSTGRLKPDWYQWDSQRTPQGMPAGWGEELHLSAGRGEELLLPAGRGEELHLPYYTCPRRGRSCTCKKGGRMS